MKQKFDFLFVDFMVEDTHKVYCNALIDALNKDHTALVVEKENYINPILNETQKLITIKTREIVGNYPFKARYNTVYNYNNMLKKINGYTFDKIIVLGYDPVMFSFMYRKLLSLGKVYVVEHHQLDEVNQSRWKIRLWNKYKDKVDHIVLDESIVNLLSVEFDISKDKIHVFPYPCIYDNNNHYFGVGKIRVLGISNSNDDRQIADLINYERKTSFFEKNNIEFIIRKKDGIDAESINSITTIEGYLSEDKYNALIKECDIVYMPFPLHYKFRCSGTLIDALAAGKKIISSEILESQFYEQLFPEICKTYGDVNTLGRKILELKELDSGNAKKRFVEYQDRMRSIGISSIEK